MSDFQLEFLGAAGGVTGSRTLVRFRSETILVDCGLFQGPKEIRAMNWDPFSKSAVSIDHVVLTHAHLDHSGYLPRLVNQGFNRPVYCSEGTADLCHLLLNDAAHLEEEFARYANKTGYSNHQPAKPLFTTEDVTSTLALLKPKARDCWHPLSEHINVRFLQAGHIIGASMVQLSLIGLNCTKLITFSGDLGHDRSLTMVSPANLLETDTLVLESTYGNRLHPRTDVLSEFALIARKTLNRKGVLVIPAFAVGRAQEVLYIIHRLEEMGEIPAVPVILDSPMAEAATKVFMKHSVDHRLGNLSESTAAFLPKLFSTTPTPDESMMACMRDGPMVVISAAGMLNGGRILHHLKHRLPKEENTVLFCGYQAEGTKGRFLQDNCTKIKTLRIHHQEVPILAEISTIASLSAHGDYLDLMDWFMCIQRKPSRVFLNHGSQDSMISFAKILSAKFPQCKFEPVLKPENFAV